MARKPAEKSLEDTIKSEIKALLTQPLEAREKIAALTLGLKLVAMERGEQYGAGLKGDEDE